MGGESKLLILVLPLVIGCVPADTPTTNVPTGDQPLLLRQLEVAIFPEEGPTLLLNPIPLGNAGCP